MNPTVKKKIDKKMEKKGRSNKKEIQRTYQPPPSEGSSSKKEIIELPKIHRNMRLICDVFRISEQTRYVLRTFDATTLEDFSFMTEEDFADLVVSQVRIGKPLPPLQQRKLFVLLSWVRSLPATIDTNNNSNNGDNACPILKAEGFELKECKSESDVLKATYKISPRNRGLGSSTFIPADWESRFYADLPRLRRELRDMGGTRSNWATEFLSLRWIICG